MKFIQKSDAVSFTNSPTCSGIEYPFGDKDLNIAIVTVNGRYPETGRVMNEVCKEIAYVLSGTGSVVVGDATQVLQAGDTVLINAGESYYWEGKDLHMLMPCSPAFYPEQHKEVV